MNDATGREEGFKEVETSDNIAYIYDVNGNMIADKNKGIVNIAYNHLNLPIHFIIDHGEEEGEITYYYDATGVKLQKVVEIENTNNINLADYDGGFIYEYTATNNPDLKFFAHAEGYVEPNGNNFDYVYQYKDHTSTSLSAGLVNTRLSYQDKDGNGSIEPNTEIVEEKNYYPFGLEHKGYNNVVNGREHPYGFLNQEEQNELGLNWLTFRYRNYMPEIGRFFGVDPVSEDYMSISTYQFAHNNPIWKIELEGLEGVPVDGFDQVNHEPVVGNTNIGSSAIPIGDSTAGNYGSAYQTVSFDRSRLYASYPGESLDNLVTAGVQWLAGELTGSDVTTETAGNIEVVANAVILIASKGKNGKAASELTERAIKSEAKVTSRAARREAMRNEGIPSSQQPKSQSKNAFGREYSYETPKKGEGTETKSVQQQTMDRSHKEQPHWEAGKVKTDNGKIRTNNYGRPKLQNDKKKVDYDN